MSRSVVQLVLALLLLVTGPLQAQDLRRLTDQFIEVALGQEYRVGYSYLKRWTGSVRLSVVYDTPLPPSIDELIDEQLRLLNQATGVQFTRTAEQANMTLVFTRGDQMAALWRNQARGSIPADALCVSQIASTKQGEIVRALILIPVDRASERGKLLSCIVEELTQSLGLINDSEDLYPSIFNDHSKNQMMTSLDWLLLRTLYDTALTPGMTLDQLRRPAEATLKRLIEQGVMRDAELQLKASPLYPLMEID